tara:strand:- start:204 stop:707 length:504 start_codon:yes stop_codon:yes gene_type:complete
MKIRILIISTILNYFSLGYAQEQPFSSQNNSGYQISSEKYITDASGNIKMNVNIWGHVAQPGSHMVFEGIDMVTLLSMVGGPKSGAKLDRIKLIREVPEQDGQIVYTLNFNKFLDSGDRTNFIKIKPNDTIVIPQKFSSLLMSRASGINTILSLITLSIQISNVLSN